MSLTNSKDCPTSPLISSSKFNASANVTPSPLKSHKQSVSNSDEENLSPIRKLIRERERGLRENGNVLPLPKRHPILDPLPKLQYQKPNTRRDSQMQDDRAALNRIVSGMSQSPSLKNLNKLKSIETKLKLTKPAPKRSNTTIETGRKSARTSEYLQRILEAKEWLENTLDIQIDPQEEDDKKIIVEFASYLRNGILLAELAQKFYPNAVKKIYYGNSPTVDYKSKSGFQFKYTENINFFFAMLELMNLPTDYRFELTDLYDLKNFPKVIFCLHAVAYMLAVQRKCSRMSSNKLESVEFSDLDIAKTESNIRGLKIPNFDNFDDLDADTSVEDTVIIDKGDESVLHEDDDVQEPVNDIIEKSISLESLDKDIIDDDVFESDVEVKSEPESVVELPSDNDSDDSFRFLSTMENIHKKYESMIEEDRNSPVKSVYDDDLFASPTKSNYTSTDTEMSSPTRYNLPTLTTLRFDLAHTSPVKMSYSEYSSNRGEEIALYLEVVINLQSIARGSLFRYQMFVDKFMLKTCRESMTRFQSLIRGILARRNLTTLKKDLTFHSGGIQKLQSFMKFNQKDEKFYKINGQLLFHKLEITNLQSILRGLLLRSSIVQRRKKLLEATNEIIKLQSFIRFNTIKDRTSLEFDQIKLITPSVVILQTLIRQKLWKSHLPQSDKPIETPEQLISRVQAIIRGRNVRRLYKLVQMALNKNAKALVEVQSISRGGLSRTHLNGVLDTLYYQDKQLCQLAAIARGVMVRNQIKQQNKALQKELNSIIAVQSCFRGVLSRFEQDSMWDEIEDSVDWVLQLQAICRGYQYRKNWNDKLKYYNLPRNVAKIIKIQSLIKTRNQGSLYKSLTTMETPPLVAIKKFIGLLNESELEFDTEITLSKTKDLINKTSSQILKLEEELDHLDIKIEMLTKNKITIDELAAYRKHPHTKLPNVSESDKQNLPKSTRDKIELYGKIVYLLQTRSSYYIKLFDVIEEHDFRYDLGLHENIEDFILKMFGYSLNQANSKQLSREEFLTVSLILDLIYHSINSCRSIEEYKNWNKIDTTLKGLTQRRFAWELLLEAFENLVEQRTLMKEIFVHNVETIIMDDEVDLESHPILIYRSILEDEERRSGKPSNKPTEITAQDAIQDSATRDHFVKNLGNLREISNELLLAIEDSIGKLPMHIRVLLKGVFQYSQRKFPKVSERSHLSVIGRIFMKHYFLPILLRPENYGISLLQTVSNPSKIKKNMCEVAKVLYQLMSMKLFSAKNVYLQPLNEYVELSSESVHKLLQKLIDVQDMELVYNMNLYDDIVSDPKPTILMNSDDCKSLTRMINTEIDVLLPTRTDTLRKFLNDLKTIHEDPFRNVPQLKLELIPVAEDEQSTSADTRKLFLQAKRCIMYLIQVQNGDNLVDLLVSHIEPKHEKMFKDLIMQEKKDLTTRNIQQPYSGGLLSIQSYDAKTGETINYDLTKLSYHDLKRITLEKLLELERLGEVTRQDGFQKLLSEMANDIKDKHNHRLQLQKELDRAAETLSKLKSKQKTLQRQLDNYNNEIEQAIESLHSSSSGKKKGFFSKIFSRQFYYQRELKKSGRLPRFGSYKYSAKYLHDNGILKEVIGLQSIEHELSSSGSSKIPKVDFSFSCDKVGIFEIEMRNGTSIMGGALERLTLDELLELQYKGNKIVNLFKGVAKFNVDALMGFIFRKFYDKH